MTERRPEGTASISVNLCTERDWYAWALCGQIPKVETYPVDLVWAE